MILYSFFVMAKLNIQEEFNLQSEERTQKDDDLIAYINKRQKDMDTARSRESKKWDIWEESIKSPIQDRDDGKASVNMPIEQSLCEMRVWLIPGILEYKVAPNGKADVDILEPAKYVLDFFVEKEKVITELRKRDRDKAKYGTGIIYSWLWFETRILNEATGEWGFYNTEYEETKKTIRHIGIKNVPIRNFWVDEVALTIEDAMDCIRQEELSVEELRTRYLDDKWKNIKGFKFINSVWVDAWEEKSYRGQDNISQRRCILRHYYNKLNGQYVILANKRRNIYTGNMTMKHWELPFAVSQEYQRTDSFYWIGIPEKCKSTKPYINNFFKAALDRTRKGSAIMTIWVESDGDLRDDPSVTAQRNFTGQGNVIPYEPNRDVTPNISMIEQMELWNTKNTGVSVDPNFVLQAKTAFQVWVFKEEQNARLKPNNDARNIAIDRALTIMLANISQFAPYLYADAILDKKTDEVKDYNWMEISTKGKEITKKWGKQEFKDRPGVRDFFDLDDKLLINGWMCKVRIDTPTTTTNLKALEKAEFNEMLQSIISLIQVKPELAEKLPVDDIISKLELLYWFDIENLTARTAEKMNRKKIWDLKAGIAKIWSQQPLQLNEIEDAGMANQLQETEQGASQPMWAALWMSGTSKPGSGGVEWAKAIPQGGERPQMGF